MQIKGFTILELVLVMAVTSILFVIGNLVYNNVFISFNEFQKRNEYEKDLLRFTYYLKTDINRSNSIEQGPNNILFTSQFMENKSYHFTEDIVRIVSKDYIDTLPICVKSFVIVNEDEERKLKLNLENNNSKLELDFEITKNLENKVNRELFNVN